ncbi:MAG: SAM-dependent methyltransferase, partial [Parabacteroides sp.]|nr:SAM-dependent methyltransferase [Parabacteroides sp.]
RSIYGFSSGQNLYLPRHICKVMANLIDIRITDYVYDPLCNNGSMLLSAFESAMINEYGTAKTILTDDDGFNAMPYALFVNNELQAPALLGKGTDCHQLYLPC